ncbi:MAG TPA: helix-turn-helix transcriptional regulator [Gammaproteobacteria bacterium]
MDMKTLNNDAILAEMGERLRRLRLNANIGQEDLAKATGLSRKTIQNAESGHNCSMDTLVRMLRGLGELEQLDNFMPAPGLSPIQLARLHGKTRRRARGKPGGTPENKGKWQW